MGSDDNMMGKGLWVKLSVDFLDDPKIVAVGVEGEALFIRGLAWAKKQDEPVIPKLMLPRLGFALSDPVAVAGRLVDVGLWSDDGDGFRVSAWDSWQTDRVRRTAASARGNHARWHRGKPVEGCEWCAPAAPVIQVGDSVQQLCGRLAELMIGNGCKPPVVSTTWLKDMDAIIRIDRRETAEVLRVIEWCQQDAFWKANIMSPGKLRKQFDTLKMRMGLTMPTVTVAAIPAWVANPECELCHGDGLVPTGEDNTYGPCPCRRPG